jgi:SAM-dependent methyltransferase
MDNPFTNLVAMPAVWNLTQEILGAPDFKRKLYTSVLHPPCRLLDFGCASGHLADAFVDFEYYGLDIDPHAIAAAAARFRDKPNMRFVAADIRDQPFEPNFFDEILFAATVHHLTDDQLRTVMRELYTCLRPGGVIHIFDPVLQDKDGWQAHLLRRLDQGRQPRSVPQIQELVASLDLYTLGEPSLHRPYGALLQDCDFVHLPLTKPAQTPA